MTWRPDGEQGWESAKIAHLVVPYTRGRVLEIGAGREKCWPHFISVDDLTDTRLNQEIRPNIIAKADDLSPYLSDGGPIEGMRIPDESCDAVFSSHCLEHLVDTKKTLVEWWRVIKPGGHLCLYLPHKELYPNIGQPKANPDHKHDFLPDDIIDHMYAVAEDSGYGWVCRENEVRSAGNEYSFFIVFMKRPCESSSTDSLPQKTAK